MGAIPTKVEEKRKWLCWADPLHYPAGFVVCDRIMLDREVVEKRDIALATARTATCARLLVHLIETNVAAEVTDQLEVFTPFYQPPLAADLMVFVIQCSGRDGLERELLDRLEADDVPFALGAVDAVVVDDDRADEAPRLGPASVRIDADDTLVPFKIAADAFARNIDDEVSGHMEHAVAVQLGDLIELRPIGALGVAGYQLSDLMIIFEVHAALPARSIAGTLPSSGGLS